MPPFPPRRKEGPSTIEVNVLEPHIIEAPVSYMTEQQASEMTQVIVAQLHEFEE